MSYESLTTIEAGDLLADRAFDQLSTAILRNELTAGTSLSVPELSRRLGISRSPVREAVQRLIYDGLADWRGRRGTVVSSIELSDFVALLEVREVLEGLAARLAALRATREEIDDLARLQEQFLAVSHADADATESAFVDLDMQFHALVRSMARNADLSTVLARTQGRAHLSLHGLWQGSRNVTAAQSEHGTICAAITARDPDRADLAARAHISALRDRVQADAAANPSDS